MERDQRVNKELRENGWTVLRFWQHKIKNDLEECVSEVKNAVNS